MAKGSTKIFLVHFGIWSMMTSAILLSCKPDDERATDNSSATKTLQNFAIKDPYHTNPSLEFKWSWCVGDPEMRADVKKFIDFDSKIEIRETEHEELIRQELTYVLAAVPRYVLSIFSAMPKSKIVVTREASSICKTTSGERDARQFIEDDEKTAISCWQRKEREGVVIYIDPVVRLQGHKITKSGGKGTEKTSDQDAAYGIHHGLVRAFGYFVSQVLIRADFEKIKEAEEAKSGGKGSPPEYRWIDKGAIGPQERTFLLNLTREFYRVAIGRDLPADRSIFNDDSKNKEYLINESKNKDLTPYKDLLAGSEDDFLLFQQFVYAESFDTYYCSAQNRNYLQSNYPRVYQLMYQASFSLANEAPIEGQPAPKECMFMCPLKRIGKGLVDFFLGFFKYSGNVIGGFVSGTLDGIATAVEWLAYGQPTTGTIPGVGQPFPGSTYPPSPVPPSSNPDWYNGRDSLSRSSDSLSRYDYDRYRYDYDDDDDDYVYIPPSNNDRPKVKKKRCATIALGSGVNTLWIWLLFVLPILVVNFRRKD